MIIISDYIHSVSGWVISSIDTLVNLTCTISRDALMDGQVTIAERRQRLRTQLGPGKGLLDWIKLCRRFKQQNSESGHIVVTFEELQKHNKEDDCWTAFRGD